MIHTMETPAQLPRNLLRMSAAHMRMTHNSPKAHCRLRSMDHSRSSLHTPTLFQLPLHRPQLHPNPNWVRPNLRPSPSQA
jgi:hypothetical protein